MNTTKRILLLICTAPLLLLSAGCWDRTEVNDLGIVLGSSIDLKKNNQIQVAVQIPLPGQMGGPSGGGGGTGGKKSYYIDSETGPTIRQSIAKMQKRMSRYLFFAHRRVIVIGEAYARKKGIQNLYDEVARVSENRLSTYLYVAKGSGIDVLSASPKMERFSSEALRELAKSRGTIRLTMKDIAQALHNRGSDAVIPYIEVKPISGGGEKSKEVQLSGYAQLRNGLMVGKFQDRAAIGLLWASDKFRPYVTTVKGREHRDVTLRLTKGLSDIRIIPGSPLRFVLNLYAEAVVEEDQNSEDLTLPQNSNYLENQLSEQIRSDTLSAIRLMQKNHADSAAFGMDFYRAHPELWRQDYGKDWKANLDQINFTVQVRAKIIRFGLVTSNIAKTGEQP